MKTKNPSVFIDEDLYGLVKDKIPNQLPDYIYHKCNKNFIPSISNTIIYINIHIDSSTKYGLVSLSILVDKEKKLF